MTLVFRPKRSAGLLPARLTFAQVAQLMPLRPKSTAPLQLPAQVRRVLPPSVAHAVSPPGPQIPAVISQLGLTPSSAIALLGGKTPITAAVVAGTVNAVQNLQQNPTTSVVALAAGLEPVVTAPATVVESIASAVSSIFGGDSVDTTHAIWAGKQHPQTVRL